MARHLPRARLECTHAPVVKALGVSRSVADFGQLTALPRTFLSHLSALCSYLPRASGRPSAPAIFPSRGRMTKGISILLQAEL